MDDNPRHVSGADAGSRDMSRYTTTVADAVNLFDEAGVPRSDRSIQRYCKRGHLDCYLLDREQDVTYMIDPDSIERRIEELRQLSEIHQQPGVATHRDISRHDAPQRDTARHGATTDDKNEQVKESEHEISRVKKLESEIRKLEDANLIKEIELKVKDKLLVDLNEQRRQDIEVITRLGESVGEWKTKYLQLAPPTEAARIVERPEERGDIGDGETTFDDSEHHS